MPLINRIELASFMNSRRHEPWRPDWIYQVFNLKGENSAINMPNGRGKSTLVGGVLGMLVGDSKVLNDIRQKHFAPASHGHFTHIRIEVSIAADDDAMVDLVAQSGGDFSGYPMVFGLYGNGGESRDYVLYSYRGTFESCPVGRRDGHNVVLTSNNAFLEALDALPSRFPATRREGTLTNWREHVGSLFDGPSIEQQLVYQKAKGAEGSSNYFAVNVPRGRPYSEGVFYERLAPELLVDMMGNIDEYANERGIEDTIHEKVRNIIGAKTRTDKAARLLAETEHLLAELERVQEKADIATKAEAEAHTALEEASVAQAIFKHLIIDEPLPGVPRTPPPEAPALARWMAMQSGVWYFTDLGFEQLTGEKPADVNERAAKHHFASHAVSRQLILGFAGEGVPDLAGSAPRGGGRLYGKQCAIALLSATTHYRSGLDRNAVTLAVNDAFAWVESYADTNPARLEKRHIEALHQQAGREHQALTEQGKILNDEREGLVSEQREIDAQQAEYGRMARSELFSEEEMRTPLQTGKLVAEELKSADGELSGHRSRMDQSKEVYEQWKDFVAEHGDDADPDVVLSGLEEAVEVAESQEEGAKGRKQSASEATIIARSEAREAAAAQRQVSERSRRLEELDDKVRSFVEVFGDEVPDKLEANVKADLESAELRDKKIHTSRTQMEDGLRALEAFEAAHGIAVSPAAWLQQRDQRRRQLMSEISGLQGQLEDLKTRRADLDNHAVAAGRVAREVLSLAGPDAVPLHDAVERMELVPERKKEVLSLFSALLFSPVYADADRAAAVATQLAEHEVESPVFVANELEQFCKAGEIAFDGRVARTWLVGVRTRPVDCLLDPTLVEREKKELDETIERVAADQVTKSQEEEALHPDRPDAQQAYKAREAISKRYRELDAELDAEQAPLRESLPLLRKRASAESIESIRAAIAYRKLLAGDTYEEVSAQLAQANQRHDKAEAAVGVCEAQEGDANSQWERCSRDLSAATKLLASFEKELKRIGTFMRADGPKFMRTAAEVLASLAAGKAAAEARNAFRFELVDSFLKSGGSRLKEIEDRLHQIGIQHDGIRKRLEEIGKEYEALGAQAISLNEPALAVDNIVCTLRRKWRELVLRDRIPITVQHEQLMAHPAYESATDARHAEGIEGIVTALHALAERLEDINAGVLSQNLDNTRKQSAGAREAYHREIDRVKADGMADEQVQIGLEEAKESLGVLTQLITGTKSNYSRSKEANEQAAAYLDGQWSEIGSWLENFTRRLPSNLETMKAVFRPRRDPVSGEIAKAGFEIEAKLADTKDVRAVLDGIVEKVEKRERSRDALGDDEAAQAMVDKNLRKDIREQFYRSVIIEPKIRVCVPAISQKALLLEKDMASSGQGVAMTLLWIVKMADYVTERDLSRQSVSAAARKRIRRQRTQFVFIDGAFSHLSDPRLIDDALTGVQESRGKFQLLITGHDPNYQNKWEYFPTYVVAREIGGNLMYADSETRRLIQPEELGARLGVMELASFQRVAG